MHRCVDEIVKYLIDNREKLNEKKGINMKELKCKISAKYKLSRQPKFSDIISGLPTKYRDEFLPYLISKPIRTASGIAVVAVMCKPHRCPHIALTGNICVYCPGGPDSDFEYSTQSYTGYEPTSMRAIRARYDPTIQTKHRMTQLKELGHSIDKIEFIIMGGTFMALPMEYRENFIMKLHDSLSNHSSITLKESIEYSERSLTKCVGITIETRPDYCMKKHLSDMLIYGCTRLEIGVQSIYEDVARDTNRGHTVGAVCESFSMAKDAGFKVVAHMMPDLPNVNYSRDLYQFERYFQSPRFRSDGLKLYPTLVIRGTGLYELWKKGKYTSYPPEVLIKLTAEILSLVPPWTRVYRVQRDIPMPLVSSGVKHGNLRQLSLQYMNDHGTKCRDVRTREIGVQNCQNKFNNDNKENTTNRKISYNLKNIQLIRRDYSANNGWETFLSYEDVKEDVLIALLRLRRCSSENTFRKELTGQISSIVRELHVYGSVVAVGSRSDIKFQHHGYGKQLMKEAEEIALNEHGSEKISIISGIGTRNYYRKLGYENDGVYMSKNLITTY
ncbi:hypothetical protein SNEBB_006793 [Seison nebaliae]|nr:hypothetical protein SNEBB_006793 [Seison nebaliae]